MTYIADDCVILHLQGIRAVTKSDRVWGAVPGHHILEVEYKGKTISVEYAETGKRDDMYAAITKKLTQPPTLLTQPVHIEFGCHSDGVGLIGRERRRQVEEEGLTADHDDHIIVSGDLAQAGAAYALEVAGRLQDRHKLRDQALFLWPWSCRFKTTPNHIRQLVKAGALIAAEIDKLLRDGERHKLDI